MIGTFVSGAFWRWVGGLGLCLGPFVAVADTIYLSPEGLKNRDVLRVRLAPAVIFEEPMSKRSYISCIVVGERGARTPSAPFNTLEGRPEYTIIAFDASGAERSENVTINGLWIQAVVPDLDTDLDVRALFSNRDQLSGIAMGSRNYFAMARRAGDPTGALGLWRNDITLPPEPAGVKEGAVIRLLLDPPVQDANGHATSWAQRRQAEAIAAMKELMVKRMPVVHAIQDSSLTDVHRKLLEAVARERAYRLSGSGFDRTALSMLVFLLDLATVRHRDQPKGDQPADVIFFTGCEVLSHLVRSIEAASPGSSGHNEPAALLALHRRFASTDDGEQKKRITADYEALQAQGRGAKPACVLHRHFCVDSSETAAAAIDALAASEATYVSDTIAARLAKALLDLHGTADGPNPRKFDRVDLRDAAFKLLVQLLKPSASPDEARATQREDSARAARKELRDLLCDGKKISPQKDVARRALAEAGWGSPEELNALVKALLDEAIRFSHNAARSPEQSGWQRELAFSNIVQLKALIGLAGSQLPTEARAGNDIIERIAEIRRTQRDPSKANRGDGVFLELWDTPSAAP